MDPEIWTAVVNMKPGCKILVVELPQDSLYDESGVVCYTYGNMGEVTQETRIYALPFLSSPLALSTQFTYDSWGRIQDITYPDNEVVSYGYDLGGQLQSITNNNNYTYLDNVTYDRFGAKNSQAYGNGIATDYSYHSLTRRLTGISSNDGTSISYTYDPVGNVTQVASSYSWMQGQNLTETFTYDASDQLTTASETQFQSYLLDVTYGNWGKISDYDLTRTDFFNGAITQESRSFAYPSDPSGVQEAQTMFAPESQTGTTDAQFTFGINGSLRRMETHSPEHNLEHYLFNSAANLKAYSSEAMDFAYYGYNASNARTYKLSLSGTYQWHNGQQLQLSLQPQLSMFYPNAYINFNGNGEYTKHYYSGSERIASRLGNANMDITVTANARLTSRSTQLDSRFQEDILDLMTEGVSVSSSGGVNVSSLESPTGTASDIYYYHTNHLGSTAFVTDQNQNVTQGFLYAPFGEITTEFNATFGSDIIPKYSFNAKELDEETGMYYYEARYYKPPVFTSRDPMFEKYFWMTPYAYCANNPIKYVDPDGEKFVVPRVKIKGQKGRYNVTFNGTSVTMQRTGIKKSKEILQYQSGANEFVDNMVASYYYIVNCEGADVDGAMKQVAESATTVKVKKQRDAGSYLWKTIRYDFSQGSKIEREDGVSGYQSPALGFWSEVYHAYLDIIDKKTKKSLSSFSDTYNMEEENYVHVTKENSVIDALNNFYGANETKRNEYEDNKCGVPMKHVTDTNSVIE